MSAGPSSSVAVTETPVPAVRSAPVSARRAVSAELDIAALYRRYGDMVLGRCRMLLGNDADAQEAVQEIFLRLHRNRAGFRGEASPSTYLFKTTTTTCLNWLRTRRRRKEDPVEDLPHVASDSLLDRVELRQLVELLLEDEDERTQAALVYVYVDGMTQDEAGELLGVTGAAVRKRLGVLRAKVAAAPRWLEDE